MRIWAFKIHNGDIFGRFSVHREFKIYVDWMPRSALKNRWRVHVSFGGMHEYGYGSTLASALIALYTVISENYASIYEYQKYLQASYMIRHRT